MSNQEIEFCSLHPKKTIKFYCFDPICSQNAKCCLTCIMNLHQNCKENHLLEKNDLQQKVNFNDKTSQLKKSISNVNKILQKQIVQVEEILQQSKQDFLNSLNQKKVQSIELTPEIIKNLKRNHQIQFDQYNNKLILQSKYNCSSDQVKDSLFFFEESLKKKFANFIEDFQMLQIVHSNNMQVTDWEHHKSIEIKETNGQLLMQRLPHDNAFNYYCAVYKIPLLQKSTFKIQVIDVYPNDRYLDIGIIDKNKYQTTKQNFQNSYNSGGISYCGYSCTSQLKGIYPTKSSGDQKGLRPGFVFYMEYQPQVQIHYWSDDKSVDLKKSMNGFQSQYYLFCTLYHPQTKFHIEKIS